jgi:excisionase family DNA binding protein
MKRLPTPSPDVLTLSETAHILRCSESSVTRLIRRGHLHRLPGLRRVLIPRSSVDSFLAKAS